MYFIGLNFDLFHRSKRRLLYSDAVFAHAAILEKISHQDPGLSQKIHDAQRTKGLTIGLLPINTTRTRLRLTLIGKNSVEISNCIVNALKEESSLRLGNIYCEVSNIALCSPPWHGINSWSDLLNPQLSQNIFFRFLTPTAIMKEDKFGNRFNHILPDPFIIFNGLYRKWSEFGGPTLRPGFLDDVRGGLCIPSTYKLHTEEIRLKEYLLIGVVGYICYTCRGADDPNLMHSLNCLSRFANFAGVGYHTAQGMGAVDSGGVS